MTRSDPPARAWEMEFELRQSAQPPALTETSKEETDANWREQLNVFFDQRAALKMIWFTRVPGSLAPDRMIVGAVQSLWNRGYDVSEAERLLPAGFAALEREDFMDLQAITAQIYEALRRAPRIPGHPYWRYERPATWEQIKRSCAAYAVAPASRPAGYDIYSNHFRDRVHAAWLGKIIGGSFGTALEGYSGDQLFKAYGDIRGYVRAPSTVNDDITYELVFLDGVERYGRNLSSSDLARLWVRLVPFGWSAELVALDNLKHGIMPPESGAFNNPYSEWIGAQMRGEVMGLLAPGNPERAAELAFSDGIISHEANGVYGEMYNAAMVSLAFDEADPRQLVVKGLDYVPARSEFADVVRRTLGWCRSSKQWQEAWKKAEHALRFFHWIHTYPNVAAVVIALWFCEGDFDKAMNISAMCGMDVDCNAGEVGAILGAARGTQGIPSRWSDPLNDTLESYVVGYERLKISDLSDWTVRLAREMA
ncbi:MAG: ADP-ribosylglycohydrolase family protein [Firmicutes bacterium]|nr:ADP-ribosylglycohydrolase family protein [Bacillota bacterium]